MMREEKRKEGKNIEGRERKGRMRDGGKEWKSVKEWKRKENGEIKQE